MANFARSLQLYEKFLLNFFFKKQNCTGNGNVSHQPCLRCYETITFKIIHLNHWTSTSLSCSSTLQLKLMFAEATANRSIYFSLT